MKKLILFVFAMLSITYVASAQDTLKALVKTNHAAIVELNGSYYMPVPYFGIVNGSLYYTGTKLLHVGNCTYDVITTLVYMGRKINFPSTTKNVYIYTADSIPLYCVKECGKNRLDLLEQDSTCKFVSQAIVYYSDIKQLFNKVYKVHKLENK